MIKIFALVCGALAFSACNSSIGSEEQSCLKDVQEFYDWYAPLAEKNSGAKIVSELAIQEKPALFSKELVAALKKDDAAQKKSQEIVGLDFDPFLYSQDPAPNYVVRSLSVKNGVCLARVGAGKSGKKALLLAELRYSENKWIFENFYNLKDEKVEGQSLLDLLGSLAFSREYSAAVRLADQGNPDGFLRLYKMASGSDSAEWSETARDKLCGLLYSRTGLWLKTFSSVDQASFENYLQHGGLAMLAYPEGIASEEEYSKAVLAKLAKHHPRDKEAKLIRVLQSLLSEDAQSRRQQ